VNNFADLTDDEFFAYFNLKDAQADCSATHPKVRADGERFPLEDIPQHWDWRDVNGVSPVKD
jgi:hypothetical protein